MTSLVRSNTRRSMVLAVVLAVAAVVLPPGPVAATGPVATSAATSSSATSDADRELAGAVLRFYRGYFDREPDVVGFTGWFCQLVQGRRTLGDVADDFAASDEFRARYGVVDDDGFLDAVYRNVFGRDVDDDGRAYWRGVLASGVTRGRVMAAMTDGEEFRARTASSEPPVVDGSPHRAATTCGDALMASHSGGMPDGFGSRLAQHPDVRVATVVSGDLVKLVETVDAQGRPVDTAAPGWAHPLDAIAVDPAGYAEFYPSIAEELALLRPGTAILPASSADVRRVGVGATFAFATGHRLEIVAVVDDRTGSGTELVVHPADAVAIGIDTERWVLVRDDDRAAVEAEARRLTPSTHHLQLQGRHDVRFLHSIASLLATQPQLKQTYGEFVMQDAGGRSIRIDPAWIDANIVTAHVPILGRVTCHRAIIEPLRRALAQLEAEGLAWTIHPASYAGCFNPRRIGPGRHLSRHSWGIALDINVGANPRGDYRTQHPRFVELMQAAGFAWGGDWSYPDPAHYEAVPVS